MTGPLLKPAHKMARKSFLQSVVENDPRNNIMLCKTLARNFLFLSFEYLPMYIEGGPVLSGLTFLALAPKSLLRLLQDMLQSCLLLNFL